MGGYGAIHLDERTPVLPDSLISEADSLFSGMCRLRDNCIKITIMLLIPFDIPYQNPCQKIEVWAIL